MQGVPKPVICAIVGLIVGALVFMVVWDWIVSLDRLAVGTFGGIVGALIGLLICLWIDR